MTEPEPVERTGGMTWRGGSARWSLRWMWERTPLPLRTVLASLMFGIALMVILDAVQTPVILEQFRENLLEDLKQPASEDRMRFDNAVRLQEQLSVALSGHIRLHEYLGDGNMRPPGGAPHAWSEEPPWILPRSLLRQFISPDWIVLLDAQGRGREFYSSTGLPLPETCRTWDTGNTGEMRVHMKVINGWPILVAGSPVTDAAGKVVAFVLVGSRLDSRFLRLSQGTFTRRGKVVALVSPETQTVIASSDPLAAPLGRSMEQLAPTYLVLAKTFFDTDASDFGVGIVSLFSVAELDRDVQLVSRVERVQNLVVTAVLTGAFSLFLLFISFRIRRHAEAVTKFTRETFGAIPKVEPMTYELLSLEWQFRWLTEAVVASRAALERENREKLGILARQIEDDERERLALQREISEREHAEAIMAAMADAARHFLDVSDWRPFLQPVLADLGNALDASRAYIFALRQGEDAHPLDLLHEWVGAGTAPRHGRGSYSLAEVGVECWREVFLQGQPAHGLVGDMPDAERIVLRRWQVRSILVVPLFVGREWWGIVGFEECRKDRPWLKSELDVLAAAVGTLGAAIQRNRVDIELHAARNEAERASRAKSEFVAAMSHELRTPLNAVVGMHFLLQKTALTDQQRDFVRKAENAAHSLLNIINEILDFSKMEAGRIEMETTEFRLSDVLDRLADVANTLARQKNIELVIRDPRGVPDCLMGDPAHLGQILLNLVNNAVKFTEEGSIVVAVDITMAGEGSVGLRFSVRDTGIGMSPAQQRRLFQAFSQADASTTRKYGGTGLGLVISKKLVESMGGSIAVVSELGKGSEFSFTAIFGACAERDLRPPPPPSSDIVAMRALVVDDLDEARESLVAMLESFGMRVTSAGNGKAALDELKRAARANEVPYDLVLADWVMPEMDGLDLIRKVQQDSEIVAVPFVMMATGYGRDDLLRQSQGLRIEEILTKPVTSSTLLNAIYNAFGLQGSGSGPDRRRRRNDRKESSDPWIAATSDDEIMQILSGRHILVVEDNDINQEIARRILEGEGAIVKLASDGAQAIAAVEAATEPFDLVLMDLHMPVMDGYEATRRLRADPAHASLPIIAMTANAMVHDRTRCLDIGMNDHVPKPINVERMLTTLVKWMQPLGPEREAAARAAARSVKAGTTLGLPSLPGIDVAAGLAGLGGDEALYRDVLIRFAEEHAGDCDLMAERMEAQDFQSMERCAHTLKGLSAAIGAKNLHVAAKDLEAAVKARGRTEVLTLLLGSAVGEMASVVETITAAFPPSAETVPEGRPMTAVPEDRPMTEGTLTDREMLAPLFVEAAARLTTFDATVDGTVAAMTLLVHDERNQRRLVELKRRLKAYDFEAGLAILRTWAEEIGVELEHERD
ncbi:MAG: response regulator [Alphaproteobacteria bacterium]|nr:response regulator [Alphaproteobacteria bacterium]